MGYEVVYHYHEKIDGKYNTEEVKFLKKKIGDPFEEVEPEKLAATILGQLARRDIWVVDVEVFELKRKQLSFKEIEGGIKINNRKYKLGENTSLIIQEEAEEIPTTSAQVPSVIVKNPNVQPHELINPPKVNRPIRHLIYQPNDRQIITIGRRYKLTVDKTYAVFSEKQKKINGPTGPTIQNIVSVDDDLGNRIEVVDDYFVPVPRLEFENGYAFANNQPKDTLSWSGVVDNNTQDMIDIRRR